MAPSHTFSLAAYISIPVKILQKTSNNETLLQFISLTDVFVVIYIGKSMDFMKLFSTLLSSYISLKGSPLVSTCLTILRGPSWIYTVFHVILKVLLFHLYQVICGGGEGLRINFISLHCRFNCVRLFRWGQQGLFQKKLSVCSFHI